MFTVLRYATREIAYRKEDISTQGFGFPWGHVRTFSSRLTADYNSGNGYNWQVQQWPRLAIGDN